MNIEFHYYAIQYLCSCAGIDREEAVRIAIASQMVDDSVLPLEIVAGSEIVHVRPTQNYVFWDDSIEREVYLPFHFIPGDINKAQAERVAAVSDRFIVTPDSPIAKKILIEALGSGDPYRIGIALHSYADTWAHQHFSGKLGSSNVLDPSSPLPPAGHLQALRAPDDPSGEWEDGRLIHGLRRVVNRTRFLDAARKIYRYLRTWRHEKFDDEDFVLERLEAIWSDRKNTDRAARISSYIVDLDIPPYVRGLWLREIGIGNLYADDNPLDSGYNRMSWLRTAIPGTKHAPTRHLVDPERYGKSSFRKWNVASQAHRSAAFSLFKAGGLS